MRRVFYAILFIVVCVAALLGGFYTYLGTHGTLRCRKDSIARQLRLSDTSYYYKPYFLTKADLESVPESIREQYEESAIEGYVLARQGNWDKNVLFGQSLLLFSAGAVGLISLKRPRVDD